LPEFTSGSRAKNKNRLTAASRGCERDKRRRYEIQIALESFIVRLAGSPGDTSRVGRADARQVCPLHHHRSRRLGRSRDE
jgi:hypothetical protein